MLVKERQKNKTYNDLIEAAKFNNKSFVVPVSFVGVVDEHVDGGYITPLEAQDDFKTYISRVRKDRSNEKAINMWIVSDNLLKGAALNSVQIAETLVKYGIK